MQNHAEFFGIRSFVVVQLLQKSKEGSHCLICKTVLLLHYVFLFVTFLEDGFFVGVFFLADSFFLPVFQGCNPFAQTGRSKLQNTRASLNQQIIKQMRMRAGAENLLK